MTALSIPAPLAGPVGSGSQDSASPLEQALESRLAGIASADIVAAWQQAAVAIYRCSVVDEARLAGECKNASVSVATVLALQHAIAAAMQEVTWGRWRFRISQTVPALPENLLLTLRSLTATAVTAICAAPATPSTPPADVAPPTDDAFSTKLDDVSRQAAWLVKAAERTAAAAGAVSDRCGSVVEASAMAFIGIQTANDASTRMAEAIEELQRELSRSARISLEASAAADEAATMILHLEQAASQIGNVTDIIRRIARQTNMLALNATIEAARAGEAGRGFAVVANEVKTLAKQTSDANENIGTMVGKISSAVQAVAERVRSIKQTTADVQHMAARGAEAVAQQRAAVEEITLASQDASTAVSQMHEGIEEVAGKSFELSTAIEDLLSGAEVLGEKTRMIEGPSLAP